MSVVLDASAIIAMLKGERGAAKVAAEVGGARVSSVNSSVTSSMPVCPSAKWMPCSIHCH
jgi:PIN domain nuclease of toxin-antitoxin system